MVDIHSHILPGIDDGAKSWDVAVEMCRMAAADGISHMVASPHASDKYSYDRGAHLGILERLRELTGGTPALTLGCDFHFSFENLQSLLQGGQKYTIGDTGYLLIELSDFAIPPRFGDRLFELRTAGFRPIITHPERNMLLQQRPEQVLDWAEGGAVIQVTANSLTGGWGKVGLKVARWLLHHDAVHVVASDAHDTERRPPVLSPARTLVGDWHGTAVARALFSDNPGAIVKGTELPHFPPVRR